MQRFTQSAVSRPTSESNREGLRLGLLIVLVAATFLMGGSARSDVSSLLLLRPLTAVILVAAVVTGLSKAWRRAPALVAIAAASLLLCLLQLIPLPPSAWSALPGRQLAVDVYRSAGMALPWHPLTLTPQHTWNAFFFLLSPLAALILALALTPAQLPRVIAILVGFAMLSAGIGALQALGTPGLHLYAITNRDAAVGLLANRNHAALLCACTLSLLGLYTGASSSPASLARLKGAAAVLAALLLVVMILLTGSRAGLAWIALALPMMLWVRGRPVQSGGLAAPWRRMAAVAVVVSIVAAFVLLDRAPALLRLAETGGSSELRLHAAPAIWQAVRDHWPWGSGIGSFVEVYGIYEPQGLLGIAYLNHAHNDVLELLLTGGVPAALIAVAAAGALVRASVARNTAPANDDEPAENPRWARAGWSIVILLSLASLVDYPLRTPILALLLAVATALVARLKAEPLVLKGTHRDDPSKRPSIFRTGTYPRGAHGPAV